MRVPRAFVYICLCLLPVALFADDYSIQWADTIDTGDWDGASGVAVDLSCNIIVVGSSFIGGNTDYFIVKYDSSGTIRWLDTLDNGDEDYAQAVAVDNSNNIVVTGYCMIGGDYDYYTVKYDSSGTLLWQDILDNSGLYDIARGVAVDNAQNIIVTGYCDIGDDCVYYTVKYDPSGTIIWTDTLDNGPFDSALDVAVDKDDNVIVTGYTTTGNNNDYFTVKYDSGGTIVWTDTLDNGNNDDVAYGVAVDNDNNIYVTGYSLELGGDYDFFTVKYDSSGTILWQSTLDNGDEDNAYGIAVDENNNIVVTGRSYLAGTMDHFTVKYVPIQGISENSETGIIVGEIPCFVAPNPLREMTEIKFFFPQGNEQETDPSGAEVTSPSSYGGIRIEIYNSLGMLVREFDSGTSGLPSRIIWDGTDNSGYRLPSGVYHLMIEGGEYRATKKLLLVK